MRFFAKLIIAALAAVTLVSLLALHRQTVAGDIIRANALKPTGSISPEQIYQMSGIADEIIRANRIQTQSSYVVPKLAK